MSTGPLLQCENISIAFGGVPALQDVNFDVHGGEVHALVGANGAGKSTLMNVIGGVLQADWGRMLWSGSEVVLHNPREARELGISFVHQELAVVPQLSVAENLFLGRHPARRSGVVKWDELYARAGQLLDELGIPLDGRVLVERLSIAEQQMVEIGRALARTPRLIIMDEPTAALSEREAEQLFEVIGRLRARGIGVIYVTHRLKELSGIANRISVLRDGRHVVTAAAAEMPVGDLVRHMVGEMESGPPMAKHARDDAEVLLEVRGLSRQEEFRDVNFSVRRGEIVALAGLMGAGRSQVLESLFGMSKYEAGTVRIQGRVVRIETPADAIRHGIALVPDDRKRKGLVPGASIRCNMVLASRRRFLVREDDELQASVRMMGRLRVCARDVEAHVVTLSGGNQQKVVLAKWLLTGATTFLLDEPTRGIDVGAKAEIYALLRDLAAKGAAVLFASSEIEEVMSLADRVVVMHRGRISGELPRAEATEERIMHLATGGETH